jgi:hypothetical protein
VSYKLRNTIVLTSILLLICAAGLIYWKWYQPRELKANAKKMQEIEKQINDMAGLLQRVQELDAKYKEVKRKYDSRSKEVPTSDYSHQSYGYMSRAQDAAGSIGSVKFDMTFEGAHGGSNYGYNTYKLTAGIGDFESIYKFIYFLENGRRLYKISSLMLSQKEEVDNKTSETRSFLEFTMDLNAYFSSIDVLATSLAAKSLTAVQAPFNPFSPLVYTTLPTTAPPNQIDPANLEIKAVVPGKAFALYDQELLVLHVGDKVWRGSVTRINPVEGKVEFALDIGGIFTKMEKEIIFDKKKRFGK